METNWNRIEINLLTDSLHYLWRDRSDYFAGGNMLICFCTQQLKDRDYQGTDFFVTKGVDLARPRDAWIVWEEGGRYPDLIVELSSPFKTMKDLGIKKSLYEKTFTTKEFFCFDHSENRLMGWTKITGQTSSEIKPNDRGWLWSYQLGVWLGIWEGEIQRVNSPWVRFYSEDEKLILTRAEAAEAELNRLHTLLAKQGVINVN